MSNRQAASVTPPNVTRVNGNISGVNPVRPPGILFPPRPQQLSRNANTTNANDSQPSSSSTAPNNTTITANGTSVVDTNAESTHGSSVLSDNAPTNNDNHIHNQRSSGIGDFDLPGHLICPFLTEPPPEAVYLIDPENEDIHSALQVFNRNSLLRFASRPGILDAALHIIHPITREQIRRDRVEGMIRPVSVDIQQRINDVRLQHGLGLEDEDPWTELDAMVLEWTVRQVRSRPM